MEKKDIEIPFGAFDSELCGFEYTIPEGYKAEIKDGKVVVKKIASDDERIRSAMLRGFNSMYANQAVPTFAGEPIRDIIAWLEKQGKQESQGKSALEAAKEEKVDNQNCVKPTWSEEDECYMNECIGAIATKDGWSFEEKRKTKH